jgi:4-amino-4-deoxy-L-arabinose transferase-like glycosyltransferase
MPGIETSRLWGFWIPVVLLALVITGVLVRYGDLRQPPLCHGDEALTSLRSLSLIEQGHFWTPYWNGTVNLHKPPFYYWLVAIGYLVFGVGEFAVRFPSVLSFIILLAVVFLINRRLLGTWAGLLAAALLSIHPVLVVQSGTGMMDTLVILLFTVAGCFLWLAKEKQGFYYAWGAACGMALLSKGGGAIICLPVSLLYLAIAERRAFRKAHFYGGLGLLILLPGIWFGSQYVLHRQALFNTYVAWEVGYRLKDHNMWETLCRQKTTRYLWQSFGGLAPLAAGSALLVFFIKRHRGEKFRFNKLVFFHLLLVVGMLLSNTVKQQMYWYIIPGVIPLAVFTALAVWAALIGRLNRTTYTAICALVFAGTYLSGAYTGPVYIWIVRIAVLVAAIGGFLPAELKRAGRAALVVALVFVAWSGMSFENRNVNFAKIRDSSDLKHLAMSIPEPDDNAGPLVLDFRHYPMNVLMFYSHRNAIQVSELQESGLQECHGVFKDHGYKEIPGYESQVLEHSGKYDLVVLSKTD